MIRHGIDPVLQHWQYCLLLDKNGEGEKNVTKDVPVRIRYNHRSLCYFYHRRIRYNQRSLYYFYHWTFKKFPWIILIELFISLGFWSFFFYVVENSLLPLFIYDHCFVNNFCCRYYRMFEATQDGLARNSPVHSIHGSLLAVGELLRWVERWVDIL